MFVSDILEKPSLSPRSAHQSPLRITSSDDARGCEEVDRIPALATHILATRGTSLLKYSRLWRDCSQSFSFQKQKQKNLFIQAHALLILSCIIAGLPRALRARGTEPHTHRLWSTSFPLVVTWLTERTREGRVGQSPIPIDYGQPLFLWLSRDWPNVRAKGAWDRAPYP